MTAQRTIAIIGAGVMGKDIALANAMSGHRVLLHDDDESVMAAAPSQLKSLLRKFRMLRPPSGESEPATLVLERIHTVDRLQDLGKPDWIIENVVEDIAVKEELFTKLRPLVSSDTLIAVNTSCVPITRIAALLDEPANVIGMHFMNPVPLIDAVEVILGTKTSAATEAAGREYLASIGKEAIVVNDSPGFVSNRLSHLFMNEAAFLVQEGVAQPAEVDAVFTKGYAHQMGPLATADLIGLDTVVRSLAVLYQEFGDPKFRCCPLLRRMVDAGHLGRKSGQGFFNYRNPDVQPTQVA